MLKGFREFILRGNVIDLAVAVVIGAAFTAIVSALVEGVFNPVIALLFNAESIEQGAEPGVVAIVVHDESGVDRDRLAVDLDVDGVGMTADSCVGLEHGDLVVRVERVGRDEARHAGADDGDLHRTASSGAMTPALSTHQLQHRSASASL